MNELIFNGKNFTEFNAYYATSNFLDGAAKDVQSVSVVGRSGDLQLSNNRYKNLSLKIRVYVTRDMEASMRAMRNYLESVHGYARVEISDQPNEYRMAAYKEMFAPDSYDFKVGVVDLTFDSMPQRFLKSGETTTSVSSSSSDVSGNPVSISNPSGFTALTGLSVDIQPVQDLNGYDSPWVGGAGKNKLPNATASQTINGVTFTANADGTVTANGTATAGADCYFVGASGVYDYVSNITTGSYKLSGNLLGGGTSALFIVQEGGTILAQQTDGNDATVTLDSTKKYRIFIRVNSGKTLSNQKYYPMLRLATETSTFAPYENLCPITGHTSATVTRTVDGSATDYTINLNGTIYGGTLDVLTGVLTVTDANIASYNGETLPSTWISDRNVYASGTTPTTGAQVVYKLATPQTVQLTPQQVSLLTGTNTISTDMNNMTVTIANPSELENPTLFDSKPLIRVYGNGTLNVNNIYITVANSPYTYIDIDCELMDCYYGSNNANQYVSFSTTDYVTLRSGTNYFAYSGFGSVQVTPRWFEI